MIAFVAFDFIGLAFSAQIRATLRMTSHQGGTYRQDIQDVIFVTVFDLSPSWVDRCVFHEAKFKEPE